MGQASPECIPDAKALPGGEHFDRIGLEVSRRAGATLGDDMESLTMGRVVVAAKIENLEDLYRANRGDLAEADVRGIEVTDALIDTGSFGLLIPQSFVDQLGLEPLRTRVSRTIFGQGPITIYRAVRLTIQGRDYITDVGAVADGLPVIVGQLPLEAMDWVVDVKGQRLIGNRSMAERTWSTSFEGRGATDPSAFALLDLVDHVGETAKHACGVADRDDGDAGPEAEAVLPADPADVLGPAVRDGPHQALLGHVPADVVLLEEAGVVPARTSFGR